MKLTPINAPDAEKIEGLVRAGDFHRHGSMRRKIMPNLPTPVENVDEEESLDDGTKTKRKLLVPSESLRNSNIDDEEDENKHVSIREFKTDLREIELMMDDNDPNTDDNDANTDLDQPHSLMVDATGSMNVDQSKFFGSAGQDAFTSTPNNMNTRYASTADFTNIDLSASLNESSNKKDNFSSELKDFESMSIEHSTMSKVKECLDFSRCQDLYNLTGKIQDILSPVEVEEVLNNSHRYVDCIDSGILEALFNSVNEQQMSMTGQPVSITLKANMFDPNVSKKVEKEKMSLEEVELQRKIRQKLLMEELAMDSLPYINTINDTSKPEINTNNEIPKPDTFNEDDIPPVVMRRKKVKETSTAEGDNSVLHRTVEVRKSVRYDDNEIEAVFIESNFKDSKLKKVAAPTFNLNDTSTDDNTADSFFDASNVTPRDFHPEAIDEINERRSKYFDSPPRDQRRKIPIINIVGLDSSNEGEDRCFSPCSDATSVDFNDPNEFNMCRPMRCESLFKNIPI